MTNVEPNVEACVLDDQIGAKATDCKVEVAGDPLGNVAVKVGVNPLDCVDDVESRDLDQRHEDNRCVCWNSQHLEHWLIELDLLAVDQAPNLAQRG